jgi:hypothetical protein
MAERLSNLRNIKPELLVLPTAVSKSLNRRDKNGSAF